MKKEETEKKPVKDHATPRKRNLSHKFLVRLHMQHHAYATPSVFCRCISDCLKVMGRCFVTGVSTEFASLFYDTCNGARFNGDHVRVSNCETSVRTALQPAGHMPPTDLPLQGFVKDKIAFTQQECPSELPSDLLQLARVEKDVVVKMRTLSDAATRACVYACELESCDCTDGNPDYVDNCLDEAPLWCSNAYVQCRDNC